MRDEVEVQGCCAIGASHSPAALEGSGLNPTPLAPHPGLSHSATVRGVEGKTPSPSQSGPHYLDNTANLDPEHLGLMVTEPPPRHSDTLFDLTIAGLDKFPKAPCKPKYIVYSCACGRNVLPSTCMSLDCPRCHPWTSRRRALSVFARLTFNHVFRHNQGKVLHPVIYTVFTVPPHIREKYRDRSEWQKLRGRVWQILKGQFGARFGVEASHPVGESESSFHPHLNFLWIQKSGFHPFIDVRNLRRLWAQVLNVVDADAYTQYAGNEAQVMNWAKYVTRTFPGYHYWTGSIRWFGVYPKTTCKEAYTCLCCGEPYTILGYIDAGCVHDYWNHGFLQGRSPPWEDESNLMRFKSRKKVEACVC